jgi:serine protease Do
VGIRIEATDEGRIQGSGVLISPDGYILTAAHCIAKPGAVVEVVLADGQVRKARNLGRFQPADAGLMKILDEGSYSSVPMGKSGVLIPGQWVLALGHPAGTKDAPLRLGRILETEKGPSFLKSSCIVEPGDSGGPLFNMAGEVVGINSHISGPMEENYHSSIDAYHENWESLKDGKTIGTELGAPLQSRPSLGFRLKFQDSSALVRRVVTGSPAEKAGMRVGDLLTHANGVPISDAKSLMELISKNPERYALTVKRGESTLHLELIVPPPTESEGDDDQ